MPKRTQTYPQGHYCKVCGQHKVNEKSKLIKMLIRGLWITHRSERLAEH